MFPSSPLVLAHLLRRLIAACLGAIALVSIGVGSSSPLLAVSLILVILSGFGVILGFQCVMAARVNRHDQVARATGSLLLWSWFREASVAVKVFLWWQPFHSNRYPDQLPNRTDKTCGRGIVFVHGFVCNRGIWNAWYPILDRRKIPYVAINLEPIFTGIDSYTLLLDEAIQLMDERTGKRPLVVCHSMGGLVARAWLRAANADAKVHRIVTIGAPHNGTRLGNWAPQLTPIENAHQMRFASRWLMDLAEQETNFRRMKFVCFYSSCDNIVFPATSATLVDADNRHIAGLPHLAMALDIKVIEQSIALL